MKPSRWFDLSDPGGPAELCLLSRYLSNAQMQYNYGYTRVDYCGAPWDYIIFPGKVAVPWLLDDLQQFLAAERS